MCGPPRGPRGVCRPTLYWQYATVGSAPCVPEKGPTRKSPFEPMVSRTATLSSISEPVTRMQAFQKFAQDRVIQPILDRTEPIEQPFLAVRLLNRFALLRRIPGRIIGMGFDPIRIESPEVLRG